MGPGKTVTLNDTGMSTLMDSRRADDSMAMLAKCASVGEFWVASINVKECLEWFTV
jgi:hypothetical protein